MKRKIVLIGASTGGPGHIKKLFKDIDFLNAGFVLIQHMSKIFMTSFVEQMQSEYKVDVVPVDNKLNIENNTIYVCTQNSIIQPTQPITIAPDTSGVVTTYNPNVNILFESATSICKYADVFAVLLTGIGDDGAEGLFSLYKAGAYCIAESAESAIVYGMPKRALEKNPRVCVLSLGDIKIKLEKFLCGGN